MEGLTKKLNPSLAESQEEFVDKEAAHERDVLSLVRSYNEITDSSVRRKILDLVKTLSIR